MPVRVTDLIDVLNGNLSRFTGLITETIIVNFVVVVPFLVSVSPLAENLPHIMCNP